MHIGAAHSRPSSPHLMRPLCANPPPVSAIIPQRSHPSPRPPQQCEPSAPARPHADLRLPDTHRRRTVHPLGLLYPDLAIHPPGHHATPPKTGIRRACAIATFSPHFWKIWFCVFACALKSGISVTKSCTSTAPPRPRCSLHPAPASYLFPILSLAGMPTCLQ